MKKPINRLKGLTVLFDLDGTLADTAPDLVGATNAIMDDLGLPHVDLATLREMVGYGARALITKAAERHDITLSDNDLDHHIARFIDIYGQNPVAKSSVFPGVTDSLISLREFGAINVVATNKPRALAKAVLDGLDLSALVSGLVSPEDTPNRKPSADHLYTAIDLVGGQRHHAIMIGDSEADVAAARNANIPVLVTSFGYTLKKAPDLAADAFFDHFDELIDLIIAHAPQ